MCAGGRWGTWEGVGGWGGLHLIPSYLFLRFDSERLQASVLRLLQTPPRDNRGHEERSVTNRTQKSLSFVKGVIIPHFIVFCDLSQTVKTYFGKGRHSFTRKVGKLGLFLFTLFDTKPLVSFFVCLAYLPQWPRLAFSVFLARKKSIVKDFSKHPVCSWQ